jgi:hypothetical protein
LKSSAMRFTNNAECVKLILDLQKVSRTVLAQIDALQLLARPLTSDGPPTSDQLLKFANSDHDEIILSLLVSANRFGKLTEGAACGLISTLPASSLKDLRILRNLWEHRDEKPMLLNGKWLEDRKDNLRWLSSTYGENWSIAYSLTAGPDDLRIGNKLSLKSLQAEAEHWLKVET